MNNIKDTDACELLKNRKIFIGNLEMSEKVQLQLFKAGFKWISGNKTICKEKHLFLFTDSNHKEITLSNDMVVFYQSDKKEISPMEVLRMNILNHECPMKPFDKVLVRYDGCDWKPNIFVGYYPENIYPYAVLTGSSYRQCIPYEGNEAFMNTSKNPDDINIERK